MLFESLPNDRIVHAVSWAYFLISFSGGLMSAAGSLGTIKLSTETRITQLLRVNWGKTSNFVHTCISKISRYLHTWWYPYIQCRYSKGVNRWYDINIKYLFKMIKLKMYLIFHAPCAEKWVLRVTQWAIVWTHNVDHVWFAEHTINKAAARWSCNTLKLRGSGEWRRIKFLQRWPWTYAD